MPSSFPPPPSITPCGSKSPPKLPERFHAIALLTPFNSSQLVVADITYGWPVQGMRITTYGLERGYADFLYTPEGYYMLDSENGGSPRHIFGPIKTSEKIPPPNFLANLQATCNGMAEVLGVNTSWWCILTENNNGPARIPPTGCPPEKSANWFWLRADNQMPWRMMLINTTNEFNLPFIGRFAFAHFPTFEPISDDGLDSLVQACRKRSTRISPKASAPLKVETHEDVYRLVEAKPMISSPIQQTSILAKIHELIPGLTPPSGNNPLPGWPTRLFMTALTTPTFEPNPFPNQPYPTQVYYDWKSKRQLTRFSLPGGLLEDAILTDSKTYLIARLPDGTHKCLNNLPVGLPYPNWPERDGGVCKGVLTNNPKLSPNKTTQIFALNSMPPRVFWIWYTITNEAVMFAEVPQACNVELILTDYFSYNPSPPPFDPSLFSIPSDCLSPSPGKKAASSASRKTSPSR